MEHRHQQTEQVQAIIALLREIGAEGCPIDDVVDLIAGLRPERSPVPISGERWELVVCELADRLWELFRIEAERRRALRRLEASLRELRHLRDDR